MAGFTFDPWWLAALGIVLLLLSKARKGKISASFTAHADESSSHKRSLIKKMPQFTAQHSHSLDPLASGKVAFTSHTQTFNMETNEFEAIRAMIKGRRKIEAIKYIRELSNMDLTSAKQLTDLIESQL